MNAITTWQHNSNNDWFAFIVYVFVLREGGALRGHKRADRAIATRKIPEGKQIRSVRRPSIRTKDAAGPSPDV